MGNFIEWDRDKLTTGVAAMDAEHQRLIGYMNTLYELHAANAPARAVGEALTTMANYTVKHFADEEAYMESIGFPQLHTHRIVHADLLRRVGEFAAEFSATGSLPKPLFPFLRMWLKGHICGIDVKYGRHQAP